MNWQPIETVPSRGRVLVYRADSKKVEIAFARDFYEDVGSPDLAYTHWAHLPEPPCG